MDDDSSVMGNVLAQGRVLQSPLEKPRKASRRRALHKGRFSRLKVGRRHRRPRNHGDQSSGRELVGQLRTAVGPQEVGEGLGLQVGAQRRQGDL